MSALRRGRGEEMTVWMHSAQGEADAMGARHGDGVEDVFVTRRDGVGEPATRVAADEEQITVIETHRGRRD